MGRYCTTQLKTYFHKLQPIYGQLSSSLGIPVYLFIFFLKPLIRTLNIVHLENTYHNFYVQMEFMLIHDDVYKLFCVARYIMYIIYTHHVVVLKNLFKNKNTDYIRKHTFSFYSSSFTNFVFVCLCQWTINVIPDILYSNHLPVHLNNIYWVSK